MDYGLRKSGFGGLVIIKDLNPLFIYSAMRVMGLDSKDLPKSIDKSIFCHIPFGRKNDLILGNGGNRWKNVLHLQEERDDNEDEYVEADVH